MPKDFIWLRDEVSVPNRKRHKQLSLYLNIIIMCFTLLLSKLQRWHIGKGHFIQLISIIIIKYSWTRILQEEENQGKVEQWYSWQGSCSLPAWTFSGSLTAFPTNGVAQPSSRCDVQVKQQTYSHWISHTRVSKI